MLTRQSTINALKRARRMMFWLAQAQRDCHWCESSLIPNKSDTDVDDLTVDHMSGSYDHVLKEEKEAPAGVRIMHRRCHKSMTMSQRHESRRASEDQE